MLSRTEDKNIYGDKFLGMHVRVVEKMKQEVDAGLLSYFSNFGREKLAKHGQSTLLPTATTALPNGDPQIHQLSSPREAVR